MPAGNPSILTLDTGNSSLSLAIFTGGKLRRVLKVQRGETGRLKRFLKEHSFLGCMISAVAPVPVDVLKALRHMPVRRLNPRTTLPFRNAYRTPATLGNDRLACIAGAFRLFPGIPVLVIDAGTCIKYDFLDGKTYRGGSISPGLQMRFDALHHYTHALPQLLPGTSKLTGNDTAGSIRSGVQEGILYEMEGFISSYKKQYKNLKVVITGGDGSRLAKPLKSNIFAAPHLIHLGLYEIFTNNSG